MILEERAGGMRRAIAIDFDGCLCADAYPAIGEPNWPVIRRAQAEQRAGAGLILWTCREGRPLLDAIAACEGWGLAFDAVNESLPDWIAAFGTRPRKAGASEYWDDRAVRMPAARWNGGGGGGMMDPFGVIRLPRPKNTPRRCSTCADRFCRVRGKVVDWENCPLWRQEGAEQDGK